MSQQINDNFLNNSPKSLDDKYTRFVSGSSVPYDNIAQANTAIALAYRSRGLTVLISVAGHDVEYWYKDGVGDNNLVRKVDVTSAPTDPDALTLQQVYDLSPLDEPNIDTGGEAFQISTGISSLSLDDGEGVSLQYLHEDGVELSRIIADADSGYIERTDENGELQKFGVDDGGAFYANETSKIYLPTGFPTTGQTIIATSSSTSSWQTPSGGGSSLRFGATGEDVTTTTNRAFSLAAHNLTINNGAIISLSSTATEGTNALELNNFDVAIKGHIFSSYPRVNAGNTAADSTHPYSAFFIRNDAGEVTSPAFGAVISGSASGGAIKFNNSFTGSTTRSLSLGLIDNNGVYDEYIKLQGTLITFVKPVIDGNTPLALTDGTTITWNFSTAYNTKVTLAGNRTLAISNPRAGSYGTLVVTQDATGGRTLTLPTGSKVVAGYGSGTSITLTGTANSIDILNFYYDGTNYFWSIGKNYS